MIDLIARTQMVRRSRDDLWASTDVLIPYEIFLDIGLKKFIKNLIYENEKGAYTELHELLIKSVKSRDPLHWNRF